METLEELKEIIDNAPDGATSIGALVFIVNMIGMLDDLRIENNKLKIDLLHK